MMRRTGGFTAFCLFLLVALPAAGSAQTAVTVMGHVFAASMPVRGASVRIEQLDLGGITDADGRYSFIVSSARVQGQTVTLSVKYLRYRPQAVPIVLVGGALVQDFDLSPGGAVPRTDLPGQGARPTEPTAAPDRIARPAPVGPAINPGLPSQSRVTRLSVPAAVDSSALMDLAGPVDLTAALAGRLAGVEVVTTSTPGGSSSMLVRGAHSLFGLTQPLLVVNGVVMDNSNVTNAVQSVGLGGFDYGTGISDINPDDIATVDVLRGPAAAMRYGGQAANGVLIITTKNARGLNGFDAAGNVEYSHESLYRLPTYQNLYGQGLGGKFAFFDGKGGGVNDATDQSWGPALDGSLVLQASYQSAGRAEVRLWTAQPDNVKDYFTRGTTLSVNGSVQGGTDNGHFRASIGSRNFSGVTPQSSITRRSALFTGNTQATTRLSVAGDLMIFSDRGENRPGTGFDQSNPVSGFAHMGRQVNVDTLAVHRRDSQGRQISWNYSGQNNPSFAAFENSNHDDRTRYAAGASLTYALSPSLSATARAGTDHSSDTRNFSVAAGWMGGYPYYLGRGDFSTGGFQSDDITWSRTNVELLLREAPSSTGAVSYVFTGGLALRSDDLNTSVQGSDKLGSGATVAPMTWAGSSNTKSLFGGVEAQLHDYASLIVSARTESSTLLSQASNTTVYPAALGAFDFARASSDGMLSGAIESFVVRAGWYRSGNDASSAFAQRLGVSAATSATALVQASAPEVTSGWEIGSDIRGRRVGLEVSLYDERSENLIIPDGVGFVRTGTLSNKGVEGAVTVIPLRDGSDREWSVRATVAKNTNVVESLSGGASALALGSSFGGLSVQARTGSSLGTLVGVGFLRDPTGQLLLRDGHPLPDSATGPRVLGEASPSWIGGVSSSLRIGVVELSVLFDAHQGGKVFSASNRAGAYSGVLDETSFRPDTGLLIAGVDAATGKSNAVHVTTEDYYHSLGAITERWIYDASFVKLREARVSIMLPLHIVNALSAQSIRWSLIGRNLALWSSAPNIDPETVLSTATFRGAEMGQLPTTKSLGFQVTLTP